MGSSFKHAFDGIVVVFEEHANFRFHTAAAVIVLIAAYAFHVTRVEFLILLFTINLVLVVEMINTAIEELTNLITVKWSKQAKTAKDVAAGMALITAFGAVLVGIVIFTPYIVFLFS